MYFDTFLVFRPFILTFAKICIKVSIERDVLALSVPGREAAAAGPLREQVAAFQRLSGCNVIWQGDIFE